MNFKTENAILLIKSAKYWRNVIFCIRFCKCSRGNSKFWKYQQNLLQNDEVRTNVINYKIRKHNKFAKFFASIWPFWAHPTPHSLDFTLDPTLDLTPPHSIDSTIRSQASVESSDCGVDWVSRCEVGCRATPLTRFHTRSTSHLTLRSKPKLHTCLATECGVDWVRRCKVECRAQNCQILAKNLANARFSWQKGMPNTIPTRLYT